MARQNQTSEYSNFVAGLITEASPLTFPEHAAVDINNFVLSNTGEIRRRLGMNFEEGAIIHSAPYQSSVGQEPAVSTYTWENAGGDSSARFLVVQLGYTISFYDMANSPLSAVAKKTVELSDVYQGTYVDFTNVDGLLVAAFGSPSLLSFDYVDGEIVEGSYRLKVRDVFGVEDVVGGIDYRSPENVTKRRVGITVPTTRHNYNLRNSGWAALRYDQNNEFLGDPVIVFNTSTGSDALSSSFPDGLALPSYSDTVSLGLLPDASDGQNKLVDRFFPEVLISNQSGSFPAPNGYFIIDLLDRGKDRLEQLEDLLSSSTKYIGGLVPEEIPTDRTPFGASCVSEFAGRVFYAGFSGDVIDGDKHSPRLASYLLFSTLVTSRPDLGRCFQTGDPTSRDNSELLATDGGFIRIDGAYNIKRLVNIGSSLIVVAENGIWAVLGGSDYGFTATDSKVVKVSSRGCASPKSVVSVDESIMYWAYDGIYHVSNNELGDLSSVNITTNTIQSLYERISSSNKDSCQGYYDSFERKVRWIYGNRVRGEDDSIELVLDISLGAFYKHTIPGVGTGRPNVVCPFEVPPYRSGETEFNVVVGVDNVVSDTDNVIVTSSQVSSRTKETYYLAITSSGNILSYTFCYYNDESFLDWGVLDSAAVLVTGWVGGGDYQRNKQIPYVTFHFLRTEDGMIEDGLGDFYPARQSSCKVQAQWDWANSANSNRWGKEFQAYRYKRFYMPENAGDAFDTGFLTISTKNKLRGKGKVLSMKISTEAGKDCKLLGWSMLTGVATSV